MTLRLRTDINGEHIGTITIQNHGDPDSPVPFTFPAEHDTRKYRVLLHGDPESGVEPVGTWVIHDRGDGWVVLARKALEALTDMVDLACNKA